MSNKSQSPPLSYYLPKPDNAHTVLHIPGSHTLYIGPSACTRRHAIRAMEYGDRKDVSFLFITEADVISGDYENLIEEAVEELLSVLEPAPHIFLLSVFCIDDFLGTDEEALLDRMHQRFNSRRFAVQHINPVTFDEDHKNGMMKNHLNMYSFLIPEKEHDKGINFLGSFVSLEPECEFLQILKDWGIGPVRELFKCNTYEDYQSMAKSCLNIGMRYVTDDTVKFMTDTLSIPYYYFPASYDVKYIAEGYRHIASLLNKPMPDIDEQAVRAEKYARETAKLLQGLPVAIDSSAFILTFTTAETLINYGFNIKYIFRSRRMFEYDKPAYEEIINNYKSIEIFWKDDYGNLDTGGGKTNCLAIGADCGRLLNATYFANVWHDEGYYGFHGICRLMSLIRKVVNVSGKKE